MFMIYFHVYGIFDEKFYKLKSRVLLKFRSGIYNKITIVGKEIFLKMILNSFERSGGRESRMK